MNVFDAAERGDFERVIALCEHDANLVDAVDDKGRTPLLYAAYEGRVEVARYLLDHGATVNYRDALQVTSLHWACCRSHIQVVLLLVQMGADVTAVDNEVATPLIVAAIFGRDAVTRALLKHGGSDVDAANANRMTACHWACIKGHAGVLRQLLEAGADPSLRDADGRTPIDLARERADEECIRMIEDWERADTLVKVRRVRDATSATPPAAPPGL